jgi:MoaA/NifB/PqqE/SkfB family radical SAM enzyme
MERADTATREYTVQFTKSEQDSIDYFVGNMTLNKAYRPENPGSPEALVQLEDMRARYVEYRSGWRGIPNEAIARGLHESFVREMKKPPQSLDVETASLCDLACPHCFRQYIVTPDKIISEALFRRVIDQAVDMGVPSVKFNWRGEPLMCPKLPEFVAYAKEKGILETIINTNAVTLTEEKSRALIDAGLDMMVYSFDGGTAKTYNKMRVGRFKENTFEAVAENIERFHAIRKEMGALFPRTRIQMVLTPDSRDEVDEFRRRFEPVVDDVLIKAYEERGLNLELYNEAQQEEIKAKLSAKTGRKVENLSDAMIWEKPDGEFLYATGRLPCQQLYQRLMVSYDGSVYMCCNDWGTEHPVGYVDQAGIDHGMKDYETVYERAQKAANGYQLLNNVEMPERYANTETKVTTLQEIWDSPALNEVRRKHIEGKVNSIAACKKCTFLDTFSWDKL